jgi:hypothetical protein
MEGEPGMDITALVLADGDRAETWGRVVRDERGDWFEPPLPAGLPYWDELPVQPAWRCAVPVAGADFSRVSDRRERSGLLEGWATLSGIWSSGRLTVDRQDQREPSGRDRDEFPSWVTPPCPPPAGGWPRSRPRDGDNLNIDIGDLTETGAAVAVTTFRPGPRQLVLVVAANDPEAVEGWLRPQLGQRLCVVASRWTPEELRTVREHVSGHWDQWGLYGAGVVNDHEGQPQVVARLARLLPEIAQWAAPLPEGILQLNPWLAPAAASQPR